MRADVTHVTVLVPDADEAIEWYTGNFGFELRDDEAYAPGMRWVTVAPEGSDVEFVLQQPTDEGFGTERATTMRDRIGQATPTVLAVEDCVRTVETLRDRGVEVTSAPEELPWGVSATVVDCYGNPYNLLEPATAET
jgi:predicted enzyme related to lactoylglutathione lyase